MKNYTAAFASITLAQKARYVLNTNGYEASVIRTPKNLGKGCGYSVVTNAAPEIIAGLLEDFGIYYKAITENKQV